MPAEFEVVIGFLQLDHLAINRVKCAILAPVFLGQKRFLFGE